MKIQKEIIKLGTLGESKVGKTNLSNVFIGNKFDDEELSTIGVGNLIKKIDIKYKEKSKSISLKIWDTAGQERFKSVATQYIKSCDGLLIVYAVNDRTSFEKIEEWLKEVEEKKNTNNKVPLVLIGNKIDLENERVVSKEEGEKLAEKYNIEFFECSAKKGINVNEAFQYLIDSCVEIHHDDIFNAIKKININNEKVDNNCCKENKKKK